jgi:hypothetical protein
MTGGNAEELVAPLPESSIPAAPSPFTVLRWARQVRSIPLREGREPAQPHLITADIQFDNTADTKYSRRNAAFSRVAHLFHQNWHGIRSAAGVLPGHKIAIPVGISVNRRVLQSIISQLTQWNVEKVVFHGFSLAAETILRSLNRAGFTNYLVWHGNLSQLVWEPEVDFFKNAFNACRRGNFRRAHMLKAGMDSVFPNAFGPLLCNSPPVLARERSVPAFQSSRKIALVSAAPDIRKNIYTSLMGASLSRSLSDVLHYCKVKAPISTLSRARRVIYGGHEKHLTLLQNVDVSVNVTAIDCHPMVDLEAIGAGAFPITGPLFLDTLTDHPFTKLSEVTNPFDVVGIANRIDLIISMKPSEIQGIMADYEKRLATVSLQRYAEFLEL